LLAGCTSVAPPIGDADESNPGKQALGDNSRSQRNLGQPDYVNEYSVGIVRRVNSQAQHCIALAMYWEARGEGKEGMLAVGSVVLNRIEDDRFPDTACGVVYQGGETPPCQFSWWCDGKSDRPTNGELWEVSLSLSEELLVARPQDPTNGALFFHSATLQTPWRKQQTARVGNHIFYR